MLKHQSNANILESDGPDNIWADLTAARAYLQTLGRSCSQAAVSPDPRAVWAALALLRMQARKLS